MDARLWFALDQFRATKLDLANAVRTSEVGDLRSTPLQVEFGCADSGWPPCRITR